MKLRFFVALLVVIALGVESAAAVTGQHGEVLTASKVSAIKAGQLITVTGKGFDKTVGIYVEMCQIVPAGTLPSVCGGGENMTGAGAASFWISSNPPSYGKNLAIPFKPGGTFSVGLKVQPMIGKADCRKVQCAIYVRADHTRTQDRTHDMKIPLTFSK
jgi:CTP-dependent riboflavin kinase